MSRNASPAIVQVSLPDDARLTVDDQPTVSTSAIRTLITPPLSGGQDFGYTLTAEVVRAGRTVRVTREVTVRAGRETRVDLTEPYLTASAQR